MLRKLLCWLGWHKWIPVWRGYGTYECKHCGIPQDHYKAGC